MVDIFGRSIYQSPRGKQGPQGPPGGIKDLCAWFPKSTILQFRKHEETACFLLDDIQNDIIKEGSKITVWKSQSKSSLNLKAILPSSSMTEHPSAIEFSKNRYNADFTLLDNRPGAGLIVLMFSTDSDQTQTLVGKWTDRDGYRQNFEISVTTSEIFISGYSKKKPIVYPIMHNCREWTTFLLMYTISPYRECHFEYMINGDLNQNGNFTLDVPRVSTPHMTLGCRQDDTHYFSGKIHAFEVFSTKTSRDRIPDEISLLISNSQKIAHFTPEPSDPVTSECDDI